MIAYLHISPDDVVPLHKRGDVVCLKRAGSPVTKTERTKFLVIDDWVDAEWQAWFDKNPTALCVAYPYGQVNAAGELALLSTRKVNLALLADAANVLDTAREKAPKKQAALTIATIAAPANSTPIKQREGATK